MSRIGRKPIVIPAGVDVKIDGSTVTVKGPKGTLSRTVHQNMNVAVEDGVIHVTRPDDNKLNRSLHGLTRTLVANMVEGVEKGFSKELEINGVGYRAAKQGKDLVLNIGYSHQVIVPETRSLSPVPTSRRSASLQRRCVRSVRQSLIRARALSTLMSTSAARKARPVRAASNLNRRSETKW